MVKKGMIKTSRMPKKKKPAAPKKRTGADVKKDAAAAAVYFRAGTALVEEAGASLAETMNRAYAEAVEKIEPVRLTLTVDVPAGGGQVDWELDHQRRPGKTKGKKGKFNPAQTPTADLFDGGKKEPVVQ